MSIILKLLPLVYVVAKVSAIWLPPDTQKEKENFENCLCQSKSPTIIDTLDSDHLGIERLVIFVYRKPNTNEIISFVPHKDVQEKIPDFPDFYGDILDIDQNLSIREFFYNSPIKNLRESYRYVETVPQRESKEIVVVESEKPKILDVNANVIHSNPDNNIEIQKWQMPVDETATSLYPQPISVENVQKNTEILIDDIKNPVDNKQYHPTKDFTIDVAPEYSNGKLNSYEEYTVSGKPLKYDDPNMDSSSIQSISVQSVSNDQANVFPMGQRIPVPLIGGYGRITGWPTKTIKEFCKGCLNTYNRMKSRDDRYKPISYYHRNRHDSGRDLPFGYWLKEQLRITTLNGNRIPTSTADISALDAAIRKVLLQRGWVVTEQGRLIGRYGQRSWLSNLKLQPILVGKSFSYDRFIHGNNFHIPTKSSYSEGLLLEMIKPAKILGIVPLSITSLPQERKHNRELFTFPEGFIKSNEQRFRLQGLPLEHLMSKEQRARFQVSPLDLVSKAQRSELQVSPLDLVTNEQGARFQVSPLDLVSKAQRAELQVSPLDLVTNEQRARFQVSPLDLVTNEQRARLQGLPFEHLVSKEQSSRYQVSPLEHLVSKEQRSQLQFLPLERLVSFRTVSEKSKPLSSKASSKAKSADAAFLKQALSEVHKSQVSQRGKGSLTTLSQGRGKVRYGGFGKHHIINEEVPDWRIIGGVSAVGSGTPLELKGRSGSTI